jgi:hypothetical protein
MSEDLMKGEEGYSMATLETAMNYVMSLTWSELNEAYLTVQDDKDTKQLPQQYEYDQYLEQQTSQQNDDDHEDNQQKDYYFYQPSQNQQNQRSNQLTAQQPPIQQSNHHYEEHFDLALDDTDLDDIL